MRVAKVIKRDDLRRLYGSRVVTMSSALCFTTQRTVRPLDQFPETIEGVPYDFQGAEQVVGFNMNWLARQTSECHVLVPRSFITEQEIQDAIDILTPTLNELMPGRWLYEANQLYLHYPELLITNSHEEAHKIYDLVVRIRLNNDGTSDGAVYGDRFSFSETELNNAYIHSHLQKGSPSTGFQLFCMGGGSVFAKFINDLKSGINVASLGLLLFQLEEYLSWESLEGTPYISISGLEQETEIPAANFVALSSTSKNVLNVMALEFLKELKPYDLFHVLGRDIFDPGVDSTNTLRIERRVTELHINALLANGIVHDYNLESKRYVRTAGRRSQTSLPPTANPQIATRLNINRRFIEEAVVEQPNPAAMIKRLSPVALKYLFERIENLLTNGNKVDDKNRIQTRSSNSDIREFSESGSVPA